VTETRKDLIVESLLWLTFFMSLGLVGGLRGWW
jgi:hypothetical protein